jgi:hypothetical protein
MDHRIEFISSYCDRWCERCAFTARCSAYACQIAVGMCGDVEDAIELAIGTPQPVDGERDPTEWSAALDHVEMSPDEAAQYVREERERRERIELSPLHALAHDVAFRSHQWFTARLDALRAAADPVIAEALDLVLHDAVFIAAKLHRALAGRDRFQHDAEDDEDVDDPVQNDWNGSVKVALISIDRSEAAWRLIADASGDAEARFFADCLQDLQRLVRAEFPRADEFVRPGFDEPGR